MAKLDTYSLISYASNCAPVLAGLIKIRNLNKQQKLLLALIISLIILEAINIFIFIPVRRNNRILFNSYTIVEFSLIASSYYYSFTSSRTKVLTLASIIAFDIFCVIDIAFILGPTDLNGLARSLETLIIVVLALTYFRELLDDLRVLSLSRHPMFWLTVGALIYFPGTFLLFASYNWFSASLPPSVLFSIWNLNSVANIIFNLFVTIALWLPPDQPQPPTSARL